MKKLTNKGFIFIKCALFVLVTLCAVFHILSTERLINLVATTQGIFQATLEEFIEFIDRFY